MAALAAALLAVVWVLDARPPAGAEREAARRLCLEGLARSDTPGIFDGAGGAFANSPAVRICAEAGTSWNVEKQMHALLAAGAAALLLVLTALIPTRREVVLDAGWRQVRLADDALSRWMEAERIRASRDEGRNITPEEAQRRVEASVRNGRA